MQWTIRCLSIKLLYMQSTPVNPCICSEHPYKQWTIRCHYKPHIYSELYDATIKPPYMQWIIRCLSLKNPVYAVNPINPCICSKPPRTQVNATTLSINVYLIKCCSFLWINLLILFRQLGHRNRDMSYKNTNYMIYNEWNCINMTIADANNNMFKSIN